MYPAWKLVPLRYREANGPWYTYRPALERPTQKSPLSAIKHQGKPYATGGPPRPKSTINKVLESQLKRAGIHWACKPQTTPTAEMKPPARYRRAHHYHNLYFFSSTVPQTKSSLWKYDTEKAQRKLETACIHWLQYNKNYYTNFRDQMCQIKNKTRTL